MARGFLAGLAVGTVCVAAAGALVSVLSVPPAADGGAGADPDRPLGWSAETGTLRAEAPQPQAGGTGADSGNPAPGDADADTETSGSARDTSAPEAAATEDMVEADGDALRQQAGASDTGAQQRADAPASGAGDTAADAAPEVGEAPDAPESPEAMAATTPPSDTATADAPLVVPDAAVPAAPETDPAPAAEVAEPAQPLTGADRTDAIASPGAGGSDAAAPRRAAAEDPVTPPAAPERPEAAAAEDAVRADAAETGPRPGVGTPAETAETRQSAALQDRLPQAGGAMEAPADPENGTDAETPDTPDTPLYRNAMKPDAPGDRPRFAVVLIDDGSGPLGPEALAAFPFPVSFAIDPSHPAPAEAARGYRDQGFEVLALARPADDAGGADVVVAALDAVPDSVAVLEAPGGGVLAGRDAADAVAAVLADSGHGLVAMPDGLDTGRQLVERAGVPAVTIFRDFDSEEQEPRVIRRFLDQAAFRARQEGAVVMLGRLRADTISALVLWGLQDRAQSVALVPVSTILQEAGAASSGQ